MQTYRFSRANTQTFTTQSSGAEVNNCALDVDDIHHHSSPPCRASLWHEMLKKRIQGVALLSPILKPSPGGLAILDHYSGAVCVDIRC